LLHSIRAQHKGHNGLTINDSDDVCDIFWLGQVILRLFHHLLCTCNLVIASFLSLYVCHPAAVQFLWDSLIESANRDRISGAILAHCMGLGKSLSTITFVHTLLTHKELCGMSTCLIICPVNTLLNWHREWRQWMPSDREVDIFEVATQVSKKFRLDVIRRWHSSGGVLLLGYDAYRNLTTTTIKRTRRPAMKEVLTKSLIDPGPDIVVCDEGHLLKNCKAGITKAVSMLKTPKRIVLTGTPLQNSLAEYWTMVNFVKPNLLGSAKEFANRFINPIKNGQHSNSTERDVQIMKKRAHILFKTLDACVQRKDYSCLTKYLPPRLEYVLKIRLCEAQRDLYNAFLDFRQSTFEDGELQENRRSLFKDQQTLYRVWTHPSTLRMHENKEARRVYIDAAGYDDEVDAAKSDGTLTIVPGSSDSSLQMSPNIRMDTTEREDKVRAKLALDGVMPAAASTEPAKSSDGKPWWHAKYRDDKLHVLFQLIRRCCDIGDKLLVFTQSLFSLDLIEYFLAAIDRQWSEYFSDMGCNTWRRGKDYERIDGSLNASLRNSLQHQFNSPNKRFRLLIISTKAGGLGVNLTAANRLVIFDVSWNPSHDIQSIFRSYRFGQTKPVYIYRLLAQGTMEEKMYDRQVTKQSLALRVVDEQQVDRHFSEDDLRELYAFEPDIWNPEAAAKRPPPLLPKDRLLADLLSEMPEHIYSYHDHDSLLENRIDEGLTDSERADAWREYEEEKQLGPIIHWHVGDWLLQTGTCTVNLIVLRTLCYVSTILEYQVTILRNCSMLHRTLSNFTNGSTSLKDFTCYGLLSVDLYTDCYCPHNRIHFSFGLRNHKNATGCLRKVVSLEKAFVILVRARN
uniref:Transcriptional regulator ATRX n=1 Tax=Schistocephalus solidus TaxID=70667 RepID=A0A183SVN4_SCHSO